MRKVVFQSDDISELQGRTGKLSIGDKEFETPLYLPIINLMTGPPPVFRQGGIWKNIKIKLIQEEKTDPFMTQILHFLDFSISKSQLENWLKKTLDEWIEEKANYSPTIFADSGGFKLLFYEGIDTSKYDISPIPEDILELQLDFGCDVFASLDYPITHDLVSNEKQERRKKTIQNSLKTLDLMINKEKKRAKEKLILLPVHGYNFDSSFNFTKTMLNEIKSNGYEDISFGLAIGSLVPLSMSQDYKRIIDIVAGTLYGLKEHDNFEHANIPIHAFGVSSMGMPILAAMGVDSFDSASYANGARNLSYKNEFNDGATKFYKLKKLECNCKYCQELKDGGLERAKEILKGKPMIKHEFDGRMINKSEIYALIACHNYEKTKNSMERVKKAIKEGNLIETLIELYSKDDSKDKLDKYLHPMSNYYKSLLPKLKNYSTLSLLDFDNSKSIDKIPLKKIDNIKSISSKSSESKSLSHTPEDYNVFNTLYKPSNARILLFTSCSKQKPYSSSKTVETIKDVLSNLPNPNEVEIIILSGLYGPVPLKHDNKEPLKTYDYKLNESNEKMMNEIKSRTIKFLTRFGDEFENIVAYLTSKPYRIVMNEVKNESDSLKLLPKDPNNRDIREFYRKENLSYLEKQLKNLLEE